MAAAALLEVDGLRLAVRRADGASEELLRGVELRIARGESVGLVGPSGCGKSLTALALLGLLPDAIVRTDGSIRFDGEPLEGLGERAWRRYRGGRIGLVFQDPSTALNPVLRVGYQVEEVLAVHAGLGRDARRRRAVELLREVQLPEPEVLARRFPHELSGGQRQRVMIAIALAGEPDLLLADEPTTALDVTVQAAIMDLVRRIRADRGLALLWISHDLGVVAQCCERVVVMDAGEVVEDGPVDAVLRRPASEAGRALVAAVPRAGRTPPARDAAADGAEAVLEVRRLTVRYPAGHDWLGRVSGWQTAVDAVDLRVAAGRTLALVGESGSGKSSLGRAVLRLTEAQSGEVWFRAEPGADAVDLLQLGGAALRAARRRLGVVFQDPSGSLNPRLRIATTVTEPLRIHRACPRTELEDRAVALLERVGLPAEHARRFPAQLSGGQRQRVAIARALALEPRLVICDEAVSALDVAVQARVLALLAELQRELGVAYLFITHDLAVVEDFADEVAVMRGGRVVEAGPVSRVFAEPREDYTRALLAASPRLPALS